MLRRLDLAGFRLARTLGHGPRRERFIARFSKLGEHGAIWLALGAGGAALDEARRDRWLRAMGVVGVAYAANTVLKLVFRRRRPAVDGLPPLIGTPTGLSFPSAHTTTSAAAARALDGLLPARPLRALALALPLSRLYLGVHYPSDIVAGAALGSAIGMAAR